MVYGFRGSEIRRVSVTGSVKLASGLLKASILDNETRSLGFTVKYSGYGSRRSLLSYLMSTPP